jgi:CRP/FNR family transcriptional regulator, anaerobic regulatory protein
MRNLPLHRFDEFVPLTAREIELIESVAVARLQLRRHDVIRSQGDPVREIYLLSDGWVGCCVDVAAGTRQMVKVHLPGDMLGTPSLTLSSGAETLIALTRATVGVVPIHAFSRLFTDNPRIATAMYLAAQKERVFLMDRLTSVARTSAAQRLAAFLLNVYDRLTVVGLDDPKFELPLSQDQLADVIGITAVHANRTLFQLQESGLIARKGKSISLLDIPALRSFGAMPQRRFERSRDWALPHANEASAEPGTMVG